ncbi:MAG: peroxidase-related enzyme [Crocinitomicaceae bacterium]
MPHIDVIPYESAEGKLKSIYDDLIQSRGKLADVHMIQSLNPDSIVNHMDLYMTIMFGKSPLKRVQREMIAVVVSKNNDCNYCQEHHGAAVQHYWKDAARVQQLRDDFSKANLSEADFALCEFAAELTRNPNHDTKSATENLRSLGLTDRAILDATLIISYFNFVNRIVLGLGLAVNKDELDGYKYD